MLFNSYIFVLAFLPLTIIGYFTLTHHNCFKAANAFLLLMSLWFYAYFNVVYLPVILCSIVLNYGCYVLLGRCQTRWIRKTVAFLTIGCNFGALFLFKYYDFAVSNLNAVFSTGFALKHLLLPLGISFFTFQQVSFVIDSYRREVARYSFIEYALFVSYFPQLIAGPIVTHDELVPQLLDHKTRKLNWDNFAPGLFLLALGMGKKVLIADVFGNAVNWSFANIALLNSTEALIAMLAYTIQIYFDFSGYCDMAIGIGKMMNIDLPVNFDSPYKARTIVEFWSRWHKTLTRFFTKYIYIPLGGNRRGKARMYLNTLIVFLLSGIWHGANWTFILWGVLHGVMNVLTKMFDRVISRIPAFVNWLITFLFINLTWVLFRADSCADAWHLIGRIMEFDFGVVRQEITSVFLLPEVSLLMTVFWRITSVYLPGYSAMVLFFSVAVFLLFGWKNAKEQMDAFKPTWSRSLCVIILLVWCIFSMADVSTFLYFNF